MIPARRPFVGRAAAVLSALLLCLWIYRAFFASEDGQVRWSKMEWEPMRVNGAEVGHAALMVTAAIEGGNQPVRMQLDLGAYVTVMHRPAFERLRGANPSVRNTVTLSGSIAGRPFHDEPFGFRQDAGDPPQIHQPLRLGTLGSSFFEHRVLLLDFAGQRLAILGKGAAVPTALDSQIEYLPIEFRYGHILLTASFDGRPEPNLIFDTGSSMIPLFTSHRRWAELTHHAADDPSNTTLRASSWGKEAVLIGAPLDGILCVGSACLTRPTIYCEGSHLPNLDLDRYPHLAAGVLGNVIFDGRFTVVVDIARRRFGLFHGSPVF